MDVLFYSLVRYIPDLERQEGTNVGVLVGAEGAVEPRFVERDDLGGGQQSVRRFEELLRHLIEEERQADAQFSAPEFLHRLAYRRFSHFTITEPRQMDPAGSIPRALDDLSERLVREGGSSAHFVR
jgi:hypothetical protein